MPEPPMRDDGVTITCPACGTAFVPSGRRRYCSAACRQAAWRQRHHQAAAPVTQPSPLPRPANIYECPSCEARYLGSQRCDDCNQFCRRIGPGAPCPHCDEPIALADLLPHPPATTKGAARAD